MERTEDGKIKLGGNLTAQQLKALEKTSLNGDQILDNLDDLNSEITETATAAGVKLPENSVPKTNRTMVRSQQTMSLDEELETLNKKLDRNMKNTNIEVEEEEDVEPEPENTTGDAIKDQVLDLLNKSPNAPSAAQIASWKAKHGQNSIYAIGMGEGDVYVFTHLKRGQWKKIQEIMSKMVDADNSFDAEDEMKKKVVQYCCLWPNPLPIEFFYNSRAGVLDAIYQSVLLNSYFLSPQQTMMLTTQL